jgi:hypothetical protein
MTRALLPLLLATASCGGARPMWPGDMPGVLPIAGPPRASNEIWLSFARYAWHATGGGDTSFPVFVSAPGGNPPLGRPARVGFVRSTDQTVDNLRTLYCDWGPGREDCDSGTERGLPLVTAALDELRTRAAAAGAGAVREVRCFARGEPMGEGRLWCEGEAVVLTARPMAGPPADEIVVDSAPEPAPSRWSLGASATGGVYGSTFVVGTTLHMRYRMAELAFHMVSPPDQKAAALGFELLGRHHLGRGTDLIYGATGLLLTPLGRGGDADETRLELGVMPVLGVGWRPDLVFFGGYGQLFVDARGGVLRSTGTAILNGHDLDGVTAELVIGLTTP